MRLSFRSVVILVLAVAVAIGLSGTAALAQGQYSFYQSSIQLQNLDNQQANVVLTFYNQDGTVDATVNDTINANGQASYFPLPSSVSDGFNGSVVVSSDTQIASISNVVGANFDATAAYVGTSSGATEIQLPLLFKNNSGFYTWYNVQNIGDSTASVDIDYSDSGAGVDKTISIEPGAAKTVFQANESHSKAIFSAILTSGQPLVATVVEESSDVMFAYNGFTGGTTNPVLPLINSNNSGYITGVEIQNAGGTKTDVTVSYTPSVAGTACTETQTIQPGASKTFALNAFASGANSNCAAGARFVGSAKVTSNSASQPLVAVVNQLLPGVNGEAYNGFDANSATNSAVMPLIMDRNSGFFTSVNLQHVGGPQATITCTFANTSYQIQETLSEGESFSKIQANQIADGYVGSGSCTADQATAKIVVVVNELRSSSTADQLLVYEGISTN